MLKYDLKFDASDGGGPQVLTFYAHSTGGALDTAKLSAEGSWAELYEESDLLCRLRLVEETGVWLVSPAQSNRTD